MPKIRGEPAETRAMSLRRMSIAPLHGGLMQNIVVGVDGSRLTRAALQWAAGEAQRSDANVVVVHAVPRTELWSLSAVQVNIDDVLAELRGLLEGTWTAPLRKAKVPYTVQLVRGDPATELLRIANGNEHRCSYSAPRATRRSATLSSAAPSTKVINRSSTPVVLVPAEPQRPASRRGAPGGPNRHRSDGTPPGLELPTRLGTGTHGEALPPFRASTRYVGTRFLRVTQAWCSGDVLGVAPLLRLRPRVQRGHRDARRGGPTPRRRGKERRCKEMKRRRRCS